MSAIASGNYQFFNLIILFIIGILGHAYGITNNDIIDYDLGENVKEIISRPLVRGNITLRKSVYLH